MALIKCKECGKKISDKSKKCIHCGTIIENQKISKSFKIFISSITAIIIVIILFIGIPKIIEVNTKKEILNNIIGTWEYQKISATNGGLSYDIITFTENNSFRYTSGFIFEDNDDFKYGFDGTMHIYEDGNIFLYTEDDEYLMHFQYDNEFNELFEVDDDDGSLKQYNKTK